MSDYFERIERQIVRRVEAGAPRRSRFRLRVDLLAPALGVMVVVAIVVAVLSLHGASSPSSGARSGIELVYLAQPTPQTPVVTKAALARAADVMRHRAEAFGMSGASVRVSGANQITVQLPGVTNLAQAERELGTTAHLEFYDWEANALLPSGHTVAAQLESRDPSALLISQGTGGLPPGNPNAGSTSLFDAVKLAAKQPRQVSDDNARSGSEYYLFGAPGSVACLTAARNAGQAAPPGMHCLLAGPAPAVQDLNAGVPPGVSASQGQLLEVKQGTVVLQAADVSTTAAAPFNSPRAQFYVLKDHVSMFGNDITKPHQATDASGAPNVSFGFTAHGAKAFQTVTAAIAHRGSVVSGLGQTLDQHFAFALDSRLISVSPIDFRQYPDGIPADHGADIGGGLPNIRQLAAELRLGALPVQLRLILAK